MIFSPSLEHPEGVENRRLELNSRRPLIELALPIELPSSIELSLPIVVVDELSFH